MEIKKGQRYGGTRFIQSGQREMEGWAEGWENIPSIRIFRKPIQNDNPGINGTIWEQYSLFEMNVESYIAIIVNIHGTEETEMYGDRKDHVNKISNWITISKFLSFLLSFFLSFFLYSTILMPNKKKRM